MIAGAFGVLCSGLGGFESVCMLERLEWRMLLNGTRRNYAPACPTGYRSLTLACFGTEVRRQGKGREYCSWVSVSRRLQQMECKRMKIGCLRIANYRCFGNKDGRTFPLQFSPLGNLNLLVGPNGTGKTTVVQAIDLALNVENRYNQNLITDFDFHQCDLTRKIEIEVILTDLDPVLKSHFPSHIQWFDTSKDWEEAEIADDAKYAEGIWIRFVAEREDSTGAIRPRWILPKLAVSELDEETELSRAQHEAIEYFRISPRISAGTFAMGDNSPLGRYLRKAGYAMGRLAAGPDSYSNCDLNCDECTRKETCVRPIAQDGKNVSLGKSLSDIAKRAMQFLGDSDALPTGLGDQRGATKARLSATTLGLRTDLPDGNAGFIPYGQFSSGEKYAFAFALATQNLPQRSKPILIVEEPETALYPAAVGRILATLRQQDSPQVFITSHSETVMRHFDLASILVVGRDRCIRRLGDVIECACVEPPVALGFAYLAMPGQGSALLSDKVLLVEGPGDALTSGELDRVSATVSLVGGFLAARGWIALTCHGAGKAGQYAKILQSLRIQVCALFDGDPEGNTRAGEVKDDVPTFVYSSNRVANPRLEEALFYGLKSSAQARVIAELKMLDHYSACSHRSISGDCWLTCRKDDKQGKNPDRCKESIRDNSVRQYESIGSFPLAFRSLAKSLDSAQTGRVVELPIDSLSETE